MSDLIEAWKFLGMLDSNGVFTFQTFEDSKRATGPARYPKVLHGTFEEHEEQLSALNGAGAGIFVMVNEGDGKTAPHQRTCRTAANVIRVRALFVDLDGAPIAPVLASGLPPDWIVHSSSGRWHAYWRVSDCSVGDFSTLQSELAAHFGGDPKVTDLPRVMRVPGFLHQKSEPFCSELFLPPRYGQLEAIPS